MDCLPGLWDEQVSLMTSDNFKTKIYGSSLILYKIESAYFLSNSIVLTKL